MAGNAQADGILTPGHGRRHPGLLFQNQRQRARPERFHQFPRHRRNLLGPAVDRVMPAEMHDQRMIGGAALGGEDSGNRLCVGGIRPEAVDRLGREGNELACAQQIDCVRQIRAHGQELSSAAFKADREASSTAPSRSGAGGNLPAGWQPRGLPAPGWRRQTGPH